MFNFVFVSLIVKIEKVKLWNSGNNERYEPIKIRNVDYWYLSPLRDEKTASFKVNRRLNKWYDHGLGKGGNIIDFAILYQDCTVGEFLQKFSDDFLFTSPSFIKQGCREKNTK
jgi:DNA primase